MLTQFKCAGSKF